MLICSLVVDKLGSSGGTLSNLTVTRWFVGQGVLAEVISDHVALDFDWVPVLSRVNFADGADHIGHDDAVAEVGLDRLWLLSVRASLDCYLQFLDEPIVAWVDSVTEASFLSGSKHGDHILCGELKELVKLDTSVKLFFEWFSTWLGLSLGQNKLLLYGRHII